MEEAIELFGNDENGVKINSEGYRHIGAALGNEEFKEEYVKNKVACWVNDIIELLRLKIENTYKDTKFYITITQTFNFSPDSLMTFFTVPRHHGSQFLPAVKPLVVVFLFDFAMA